MKRSTPEERAERERLVEVARGNIERHLSDAAVEDGADAVYDTAFTLGFDAVKDATGDMDLARDVAREVAQSFAQP